MGSWNHVQHLHPLALSRTAWDQNVGRSWPRSHISPRKPNLLHRVSWMVLIRQQNEGGLLHSKTHTWSLSKGDKVLFQVPFRVNPSFRFERKVVGKDCFVLVYEHGTHAYWCLVYKVSSISKNATVSATHVCRNDPLLVFHVCLWDSWESIWCSMGQSSKYQQLSECWIRRAILPKSFFDNGRLEITDEFISYFW